MTDSKYFNEDHVERLKEAWKDMKPATRNSYIPAVKVFFDCIKTTPEKLTEKDVRRFFSGGVKGSGKQRYISGEISRTYYRAVINAAKRFIASWYDMEEAEKLLTCFESAPNDKLHVSAMSGDAIADYLELVAREDTGLFMAAICAYGACLAPKEIFSLRKSVFFEKNEKLCLSVGFGKNHRYIYLPENTALILADYLKDLMPPATIPIFEYDCKENHAGLPEVRYNRILTGLQYRHEIEGIDKKMTLQQLRTIAISCMSKKAGVQEVCEYCALSYGYPSKARQAYFGTEDPDMIIKAVWEKLYGRLYETELEELKLRKDIKKDAYIVRYPGGEEDA